MKNAIKNFEFTSYEISENQNSITFNYAFNRNNGTQLKFSETISFKNKIFSSNAPRYLVEKTIEGTHLMLGVSYYKLFCPGKVVVPYKLSISEANLWNKVYREGLGEFYHQNGLDPLKSPNFKNAKVVSKPAKLEPLERALVGIGGGKDSIVACELLRGNHIDITGFVVPQTKKSMSIIEDSIAVLKIDSIRVTRVIDQRIEDEYEGSYNGHVPISGIFAFLGLLSALIYDFKYVVVGNEQSSNFGNTEINGVTINHQWSKSSEFESLMQNYIRENLTKDISYFSILRPFDELRIVEMFVKYPKYFKHFTSCNRNFLRNQSQNSLWCGACPKCLFVFLLFSAFLKKKDLCEIYGQNLFEKEALLPLFRDILGIGGMKPFDCVGTFDEAQVAFHMAKNEFSGDFIIEKLKKEITVDEKKIKAVFKTAKETNIPDYMRFAGMKNALILGYGVEGRATQKYLADNYHGLDVGIADQNDGKDYLELQEDYDITVKTPGISISKITGYHTTATNIFFSRVKGMTIGITGTKGKSTTASLLYEILKAEGKNVELIGNIGKPMLEVLPKAQFNKIYIMELSSYQLEDIHYSPDIAVMLNLYQDHMTYHGGLENYHEAKFNIVKYQNTRDLFVYNSNDKKIVGYTKRANSVCIPFLKNEYDSRLLGEHNQTNINAACTVAKHLGVSEENITQVVRNFNGLEHRLEFVGEVGGVSYYNDSISTTPESTIAAINSLDNVKGIILGGTDRGYDFKELEKIIIKRKIQNIVLFPDSGERIFKGNKKLNILRSSDIHEAVSFCAGSLKSGEVCLLSPASPSFTLFKDYKDRGDQFKNAVKKLPPGPVIPG